jgi:hypothetical protein
LPGLTGWSLIVSSLGSLARTDKYGAKLRLARNYPLGSQSWVEGARFVGADTSMKTRENRSSQF